VFALIHIRNTLFSKVINITDKSLDKKEERNTGTSFKTIPYQIEVFYWKFESKRFIYTFHLF